MKREDFNPLDSSAKNEFERFRAGIPRLRDCTGLERIERGYSSDCKFIVRDPNGVPQYILRTYDIDQASSKGLEYNRLLLMEQQGVSCSRPVEIGTLPELNLGYMFVSHIDGNEATEELPLLSTDKQFRIGVQAGLELKKMHQVACPDEAMASWEERMTAKHRRYRKEYSQCGTVLEQEEVLLAFIDRHLYLMKNRPNLFLHDDFHAANLIVKVGELSGVIDFNRSDWGDPIHEFVKVGMLSSEVSVPFAIGQIRGYHGFLEPDETFWKLYSLYLAMTVISSVAWILKVKPEELDIMLKKIRRVMDDHDNFDSIVPKWYIGTEAVELLAKE